MSSRKKKGFSSSYSDTSSFGGECSSKLLIGDGNPLNDEAKDVQKIEQESFHLTDNNKFFPELIWNLILYKLNKPENIESCSNASPYFKHLLANKLNNKVILPKMFNILAKCYDSSCTDDKTSPFREINTDSIPWQRTKHDVNPMTGILKCRLVCKSWNTAIQTMYENSSRFEFRMDLNPPKRSCIISQATNIFEPDTHINISEKFCPHFDTTHYNHFEDKPSKNPFLDRCVILTNCRNRDDFQARFNNVMEILRKYGKEVWYFRFTCYDDIEGRPNQLSDFYRELKQMIDYMPNLKLLHISFARRQRRGASHVLNIPHNWPTEQELQALAQAISTNPVIKLPHLKFLSTEYIPTSIFNQIITQNKQINQLEVRRQSFNGGYLIFSDHLVNLRKLSLDICTLSDLKKFENCQVQLNLEKLHFYYQGTAPFIPWSRIFTAIESKVNKEVCTELLLQMPVPLRDLDRKLVLEESLEYRLNLPRLKSVTIFDDCQFCLDFLLPAKNTLSEIIIWDQTTFTRRRNGNVRQEQINRAKNMDFKDKQIVKFVGWKEKMEESNISFEFPRLKKFSMMRPVALGGCARYECKSGQVKNCEPNLVKDF